MMHEYCFSQDLGKIGDPSAYVLTEARTRVRSRTEEIRSFGDEPESDVIYPEIIVRWLERKFVPYDVVIDDARTRLSDLRLIDNCSHLIDITGVGQPVWDMMVRQGMSPIGISITSGMKANQADYGYTVPKLELISSLQLALRNRHLKFAEGLDQALVDQIRHEFATFVPKPKTGGGTSYEAWREKDHDDIILALAMNVWWIYRSHGIQVVRKRILRTENDYDPLRFGL
jgi:hypothetical protein